MGKRKKNEDVINFEVQQNTLRAVEEMLSGNASVMDEILDEARDENYTDEDFVQDIFGLMEEDRQYKHAGGFDKPVSDCDVGINSYIDHENGRKAERVAIVFDDRQDEVDEPVATNEEGTSDDKSKNRITISHNLSIEGAYNVVTFSDGIRSFSIDLLTLEPDRKDVNEVYGGNHIMISRMVLNSIMANFYPSMILTKNRLDSYMRHVTEIDDTNLWFYEFSDDDINMIVGYVFDIDSLNKFDTLCEMLKESGYLLSFLTAMVEMSAMMNGFCFRSLSAGFIHQIMLTTYMNERSREFVQDILQNQSIVKSSDDHFNESSNDILTILPSDFMSDDIVDVISVAEDDGDEYDDEDDDEDEDADDDSEEDWKNDELSEQIIAERPPEGIIWQEIEIHQEIPGNGDLDKNETVSEEIEEGPSEETDKDDDSYEDLLDDVPKESEETETDAQVDGSGDENIGGYSTDPDQAEMDYYSSKGLKPPKANSQRKPKPTEQDDPDKWIIKSR